MAFSEPAAVTAHPLILTTKLYVPPPTTQLIPRPRLFDLLNAGIHKKLTLVSAPAGFGKTTLISNWIQHSELPAAWLSIDKEDNHPATFLAYILAALQQIAPELGRSVQPMPAAAGIGESQSTSINRQVTALINDIHGAQDLKMFIVLDDYHVIHSSAIHDLITFLLDHLPPQLHIVISTRVDPLLPLPRLRSRGEITEIRIDDLRFTSAEMSQFLNDLLHLNLTAENISLLEKRTEGWIAGIQMVALSLREQTSRASFIQNLTSGDRYIMDYLVDEVLSQQTLEIQQFLLHTSILDRLCGPLCDAVAFNQKTSGQSQPILEYLEQSNLFIVPLDNRRQWYRYHHLFAELLQHRLHRQMPDWLPELHLRASQWYAGNQFVHEAIQHALATGTHGPAIQIIEKNVLTMAYSGELDTLLAWLNKLPQDIVHHRPWLCIAHGWALFFSGQVEELKAYVQRAETLLNQEKPVDKQHMMGHIAAIRAYVQAIWGNMEEAASQALVAIEHLPPADTSARAFSQVLCASSLSWNGQLDKAAHQYTDAIATCRQTGNISLILDAFGDLARMQTWQGRLRLAEQTCREALHMVSAHIELGGWEPPETGYIYTRMSTLLRERNERAAALRYARKGMELIEKWGQLEILIRNYFDIARVLHAFGENQEAVALVQKASRLAQEISSPWYMDRALACQAQMQLLLGDRQAAYHWLQQHEPDFNGRLRFELMTCYITAVRIRSAQHQDNGDSPFTRITRSLQQLLALAESCQATGYVIEILILQALTHHCQNRTGEALNILQRAVTLAKPEGFMRIFTDEGEPMAGLLRQLALQGTAPEYVGRLLESFTASITSQRQSLPEPLSERELEVLHLIAAGLTNRQIAAELVVTLGTVKTHINNLYQKLGVHNRTRAIAVARELNLF